MPQALPAILIAAVKTTALHVLGQIVKVAAFTMLNRALSKRAGSGVTPINVTVRSTVAYRMLCFGRVRASGAIMFVGTSGANNKFLWYVVAYAGHQCQALYDLYLDKLKIPAADINGTTGVVSTTVLDGKLMCWDHLGTGAQTADANIDAAFTQWTTNHRLRGTCYRVLRLERSDKVWLNGAPQAVNSVLDGALLYDPRLDSTNGGAGTHRRDDPSTWAFSRNWALVVRWFLSGGAVVNDQSTRIIKYGMQETDARIDDAYVTAAANIADQSLSGANAPPTGAQARYTLDGEYSCGQTRREILEDMLYCGGPGQLIGLHGKWRLYAGAYDAPLHTFTEQDLFGEIEVEDTDGDEDRFNRIAAIFRDASADYTEQTTKFRTNAAYVTQDGGQKLPRTIRLISVTDQYRAQRIVERMLRSARQMRTVVLNLGRQGLKVAPWETISFSHARLGWSTRVLRCIEREVTRNESGGVIVRLTTVQIASSIDTDLITADYTTGTSITNSLQSEPPDPPTALTATTRNGSIEFNWTLSAFWLQNGITELWEAASGAAFNTATKIWEGRGTRFELAKSDQTTRDYWVRVATIGGQTSSTEPASSGLAASAYFPVFATPVTDTPADGSVAYSAVTQPQVEVSGINSHITYTSPAAFATRCTVNWAGQADVSNSTSGVAVGVATITCTVQVNGSTVFTTDLRLDNFLHTPDNWALFAGSKTFDVPAGQAIDVFLNVSRTFSTGGSSPTQTIYWRKAALEIIPSKK